MFASKLNQGFYSAEIHGANMPADVVELTADEYAALMAGQASGQTIEWGDDGRPFLADPPPPSLAALCGSIDAAADALARIDHEVVAHEGHLGSDPVLGRNQRLS